MTTFILDLCNAMLPSALLVGAAWISMRFLPWNAATRYAAWWAVVAVLLVMPFAPYLELKLTDGPPPESGVYLSATSASVPVTGEAPVAQSSLREVASPRNTAPAAIHVNGEFGDGWIEVAGTTYLAIVAFFLLRLALDYYKLRRLVHQSIPSNFDCSRLAEWLGIRRKTRILVNASIDTPIAVGFLKPAIVLPASLATRLSESELQHVIVHELAHIARRDDWTNLAERMLRAFFWLHPCLAFAVHRLNVEREHACDDWAVMAAGGAAKSYARSLTRLVELTLNSRIAKRQMPMLAATVIGQGPSVSRRVEMLLSRTRNFAPKVSLIKLAMSVVCIGLFGLICTQVPTVVAMAEPAPHEVLLEELHDPQAPPAPPSASTPAAPPAPQSVQPPSAQASVPAPTPPPAMAGGPAEKPGLLAALAAAGYRDLSVDEIIELKNHGVDANYIREMSDNGWGKLNTSQLVQLKTHGVSGKYLRELKSAGIRGLTLEQAVELRNHGVRAESIAEIHGLGFGPYDLREVTEMASNGLRPSFFRGLKERGISSISARDAIEAARHGLTPQSIDEARKYGPNLSFEQILKLKRAGVI